MSILHVNNFSTTLNGSITNSQTTMVVTSATGGPAVGSGANAYLTINSGTTYETVLATAVSTNTYTITRAQQGTSASAFSSGATVMMADTAYDFDKPNTPNDATINGLTIGLGASSIATNTTVGNAANTAVTTASHTTSVGYQAGNAITTGADNTCIGYLAGLKVTTSAGNTCIGSTSGQQSGTVQQTTCIGYKAGQACSSQDTAIGYQALAAGSGDAFGYNVLNASSGSQNVGVGNATLSGGSYSGSQSTAIGCNVMPSATSGGNNTAIGYQAGYSGATGSAAITTGSSNTLLGYQASVNDATAVGALAIGKNAVADKSTGSTSGTNGPGMAIGSATFKVGFRGDGTIYPSSIGGAGFLRAKLNGTYYQIPLYADASAAINDVPDGGTGLASATAYAVICGGTTSTGAFQSVSGLGSSGNVLTSNGAGALPTWQAASGGSGLTWNVITTATTATVNNGYITNSASQINVSLPATAAVGSIVRVAGLGSGGFKLSCGSGQTIQYLGQTTTTGTTGNLAPANQYDSISVVCVVANSTWVVTEAVSTLITVT